MKRNRSENSDTAFSKKAGPFPKAPLSSEPDNDKEAIAQSKRSECDWWDDELEATFDTATQQLALSPNQSQGLKALFIEAICQAEAEEAEQLGHLRRGVLRELEINWGQSARHQFAAANQAAAALSMDHEALEAILTTSQAALIVQALAKLGEAMAEDGALPLEGRNQAMGKLNAQKNLLKLQEDKNHIAAYLNPSHPGHEAAKRQRRTLIDLTLGQNPS